MLRLSTDQTAERLSVLCLGAHADDIEIGAGGAVMSMIAGGRAVDVHWCVLSAEGERAGEARASAEAFLAGAQSANIHIGAFRDGYFPDQWSDIKTCIEALKNVVAPDVIFTHRHDDAHQDHRVVSELTWNAFRDHMILEYEIPKWDGDIGKPNTYIALDDAMMERKTALLDQFFGTQRSKTWFDADVFRGLARLRGVECRARYAEAFLTRKMSLQF